MRPASLAFASILALSGSALAGDAPGEKASLPKAGQVAADFLSKDDAARAAAEKAISEASPEFLRAVLAAVRASAEKPLFRGVVLRNGGPSTEPPDLPPPEATAAKRIVNLEVRFLDMTQDLLRDLTAPFGSFGFARKEWTDASGYAYLDEDQVAALLRAAEKDLGLRVMTHPRMTVYDGQQATIDLLNATEYVDDYAVEAGVAKPVVKRVVDGFVLDARPTVSADGTSVRLDLTTKVRRITKPIEEQQVSLPGVDGRVRVQRPEQRTEEWSKSLTIPDGGSVMVGGWTSEDPERKGQVTLVLVTAQAIDVPTSGIEPKEPSKAPGPR